MANNGQRIGLPEELRNGCVLYLPGDVSGTTAFDASGSGNNGTLVNSPTVTRGGLWGYKGFKGNGTSQYISFGNLAPYFTTTGSFICYVKLNVASPSDYKKSGLVLFSSSVSFTHYVYAGLLYCNILRSTRVDGITPSSLVDREKWHVFCVTSEPGTNGYKIYQNDILIYQGNGESTIGISSESRIMSSGPWENVFLDGDMRHSLLTTKVLSVSDIRLYMEAFFTP